MRQNQISKIEKVLISMWKITEQEWKNSGRDEDTMGNDEKSTEKRELREKNT